MGKNILLLCCGYPFETDKGFGYHVAKVLEKMELPENVDFMEVGESACMIPSLIEGKDKMIIIDVFQTKDKPGTIVRFEQPKEVPVTFNGVTDIPKLHLIETLERISMSGGKCPRTIFLGVVPKDTESESSDLTSEIKSKIPEIIDILLKELNCE